MIMPLFLEEEILEEQEEILETEYLMGRGAYGGSNFLAQEELILDEEIVVDDFFLDSL